MGTGQVMWNMQLKGLHMCSQVLDLFNSLGPKFSSQGHFHSLQLLNVPQFLFSWLVRLKTAPRCNFSHA